MLLTGITEGADWISKTSLSPDSLIALLWRIWQMLEQHEQLKQNASSTKLGLSFSSTCNDLQSLRGQNVGAIALCVQGGKGEKGKIETSRKKLPPNDEVPSSIRQMYGTGNMLFAFRGIIQKWIIAKALEDLEIHRASREEINKLWSTCTCPNKQQNIRRRQGADVWQLIPSSDIYLPVALFSDLLSTPCSCWFYKLCSAFLRSKTNGKYSSHVLEDLIHTVGKYRTDA